MPPIIQQHEQVHPKPTPRLLSILLKALIMTLLTSSFFLFLGLAAFLLLSLCLLAALCHRLRSPLLGPTCSRGGILPRGIKNLPHFRVPPCASHPLLRDSLCVVCLEGFRSGHWCRKLPSCGHVFHRTCVDAWLLKKASCPTCRTPVRSFAHHDLDLGVSDGGRRRRMMMMCDDDEQHRVEY